MNKDDLLKFCRYYHGENENPFRPVDKSLLWDYERKWVEMTQSSLSKNRDSESTDVFGDMLDDYVNAGLAQFESHDDTPATLKALIFNRFCYWNSGSMRDCVPGFKQFYKKNYR